MGVSPGAIPNLSKLRVILDTRSNTLTHVPISRRKVEVFVFFAVALSLFIFVSVVACCTPVVF